MFTWEVFEACAKDKRSRFSQGTVFFYPGTVWAGDILWSSPMLERRVGRLRLPEGGDGALSLFAPHARTVRGTAHMSDRGGHAAETVIAASASSSLGHAKADRYYLRRGCSLWSLVVGRATVPAAAIKLLFDIAGRGTSSFWHSTRRWTLVRSGQRSDSDYKSLQD